MSGQAFEINGEHVVLEVVKDLIISHPELFFVMKRHFAHQETLCLSVSVCARQILNNALTLARNMIDIHKYNAEGKANIFKCFFINLGI